MVYPEINEKIFLKPVKTQVNKSIHWKATRSQIISLIHSSSIHGLPKLFEDRKIILKIIWLICFLASSGGCAYLIYRSLSEYLKFEVVTKFSSVYEVPMEFPTVSICNINPFLTNESDRFIFEYLDQQKLSFSDILTSDIITMNILKYLFTYYIYSRISSDSDKKKLGIPLDNLLLSCIFNQQPCSSNDFEWYFDAVYGNCYKLNSGKNATGHNVELRNITRSGEDNGLTLHLYFPNPKKIISTEILKGLYIMIHNTNTLPYSSDGITISPGAHTGISVSKVSSIKIPYPYSECVVDSNSNDKSYLYTETVNRYKIYKQNYCFDLCTQREIIEKCGCHVLNSPSLYSNTPCMNMTQLVCGITIAGQFILNDVKTKCKECPLECESEKYDLKITQAGFPTDNYADSLIKSKPEIFKDFIWKNYSQDIYYDKLRQNLLSFSVHFKEMEYIKVEQSIKTPIEDLVSSVGGTLGLFLGVSFLSFIELFEILLNVCFFLKFL